MDVETLSIELGMDLHTMMTKVSEMNLKHDLRIEDTTQLTRTQYDIIRSAFDTGYLVSLLKGDKRGGKYNYTNSHGYIDAMDWIHQNNLSGKSLKEVGELLPPTLKSVGRQTLAAAMKASGYVSRVVTLENGIQGRRWFDNKSWGDGPSFL